MKTHSIIDMKAKESNFRPNKFTWAALPNDKKEMLKRGFRHLSELEMQSMSWVYCKDSTWHGMK